MTFLYYFEGELKKQAQKMMTMVGPQLDQAPMQMDVTLENPFAAKNKFIPVPNSGVRDSELFLMNLKAKSNEQIRKNVFK